MNARHGFYIRALIALLALAPAVAGAQTWTGSGPFPSNANSRTVHALAIDARTGTIYAGTGSGTVFAMGDASLSQQPVAGNDSIVVDPDTAAGIAVLANDFDPEGALDTGSIEIRTSPTNGAAAVSAGGIVTYTPAAGFVGADSFSYTVRDQAGRESNVAIVSVRVNALPVAANDAANTQQGEPVTIDVLANDLCSARHLEIEPLPTVRADGRRLPPHPGAAAAARPCRAAKSRRVAQHLGSGVRLRLHERRAFQSRVSQPVRMSAARCQGYCEGALTGIGHDRCLRRGLAHQNLRSR